MQLSIPVAAGLVETSPEVRKCLVFLITVPVDAQQCDNKLEQRLILFCLRAGNFAFLQW